MIDKQDLIRAIAKNAQGSILPMGAAGFLVAAALVGGGVDMSRAYKAKSRLQAACDAGVLSGRRTVTTDGFDSVALGQANSYFATNYDDGREGTRDTTFVATSDDDGQTIAGVASSTIDTIVMKIFGFMDMSIAVDCTASMGVGNSDITMVLDSTGSMAWGVNGNWNPPPGESRLENLQVAMMNFYDTVDAAMSSSNARVRYAFTPYNTTVNVGQILSDLNPDFLATNYNIQSRQWFRWSDPVNGSESSTSGFYTDSWEKIKNPKYSTSFACASALPGNTGWQNDGPPTTTPTEISINNQGQRVTVNSAVQDQTSIKYKCKPNNKKTKYFVFFKNRYRTLSTENTSVESAIFDVDDPGDPADDMMFRQVEYDLGAYRSFDTVWTLTGGTGSNPAWESSVWEGCIEERRTVSAGTFTFVPGTGITPSGALDLDIDGAPNMADDTTRWAPMWPNVAYFRDAGTDFSLDGSAAESFCPTASRTLAEYNDRDDFEDYANSLDADGFTYHDIGLIWGARLSSPDGIWGDLVREAPGNGGNVSRHLIFMTDGDLVVRTDIQTSYGIERNDQRVTDNGATDQWSRHRARLLAVCGAVRDKGIRLWVIAFGTVLTPDLTACASANSAFAATNAAQLNETFQEIANQVGELRVTQ